MVDGVSLCNSPLPTEIIKHFISQFYYDSRHIKIPKINSFLPIQLPNILLLNFTHIFIFTNTIVWTFCFFCLLKWLLNISLVMLFDLQLCVLSFPCNYTLDITLSNRNNYMKPYNCACTGHWNDRVFANGLGDLGSIPSQVIPKTQKMVLDASLLNTQQYKVGIKGKVE